MSESPSPYQVHADLVGAVRRHVPVPKQAHAFAMLAKESIFKAQDMLYDAPHHLQTKLGKRLAKLRSDLEALDRECRR